MKNNNELLEACLKLKNWRDKPDKGLTPGVYFDDERLLRAIDREVERQKAAASEKNPDDEEEPLIMVVNLTDLLAEQKETNRLLRDIADDINILRTSQSM